MPDSKSSEPYEDPDEIDLVEVDREAFRPKGNCDRLKSVICALDGLRYLLVREQSIQLLTAFTLVVLGLAIWLQLSLMEGVELLIVLGLAWITEALNTAIEAAVDLAMPDVHPLAKVAKDVGSAGALLSALLALVVAGLLLGPPLVTRLGL